MGFLVLLLGFFGLTGCFLLSFLGLLLSLFGLLLSLFGLAGGLLLSLLGITSHLGYAHIYLSSATGNCFGHLTT